MATSEARSAASRLNGSKSVGPTSTCGKQISSRNSLKHGLSGQGIVIAEVDENSVRIGGDNSLHISEVNWFVERTPDAPVFPMTLPAVPEEEQRTVEAICGAMVQALHARGHPTSGRTGSYQCMSANRAPRAGASSSAMCIIAGRYIAAASRKSIHTANCPP